MHASGDLLHDPSPGWSQSGGAGSRIPQPGIAGVRGPRYGCGMARPLRPLADREAMLALALAGLGFVSMEATLPAAGVLGVRAIRSKRAGDGCEPVIGILVLGVAWLSFLLGYPTLRSVAITAWHADDVLRIIGFLAGWIVLAFGAFVLATFLLHVHPERWVARAAARAGIVAIATAGLLQAYTVTADKRTVSDLCGTSNADCLGRTPWSSLVPALAIGVAWLVASLILPSIMRSWDDLRRRLRRVRPYRAY
jgi:hypothetical protein